MNRSVLSLPMACLCLLLPVSNVSAQGGRSDVSERPLETISVAELHSLLKQQRQAEKEAAESGQQPPEAKFVVVDVRSDAEINVSVIPGAITKAQYEQNRARYRGRTVFPYCTIGGRSARYARQLQANGVDVKNFKGSILAWVGAELPVVTLEGKPTQRVHTHSDRYRIPEQYEAVTD